MNTKPAALAAAGTVLLWASAFPAITVAVRGLGPAGLAVARLAVASAALALAAPWMGGRGKAGRMGVRRPKLGDLPLIALCGLAGMTGYQLLLNAGERVVPAGTASLLVATAPVYASLLAVAFLGERATRPPCQPAPCQPALGQPALGRQRGGAGRHRADRRLARARLRGVGADRAGRGGAPGDLPHRAKAAAGPVHRLRGDRLRHVGRHRVCPPVDRVAAAGPVGAGGARGRGGHRLGGLPRPGAVRGRVRAVGLRHGADGRRAGHGQPVPGARRRDWNLAGLAGPGPGAGRADRRGDRAGRSAAGQRRGLRRRGG